MPPIPRIAAVISVYFPHSHADVIVTRLLRGLVTDEGNHEPRVRVASLYIDQFPAEDIGRGIAAEHGVPIYESIVKALTLGGRELAVDGVLLIGEHGDYAWNEREQQLFPRKFFMEQICGVLATSRRAVPIFNDKHLSWNWHDARWMYDRARELGAPFMAGSTLPLAWRNPWLELDRGAPLTEAVAIGYSGLDIYGFHTLEVLQCMAERRAGGETGVAAVTCLEGDAVWEHADSAAGWWRDLAAAACGAIVRRPPGDPATVMRSSTPNPALFLVEYRDGFRGAALMLNGYVEDLAFAGRLAGGEVLATEFWLQNNPPHSHFCYLARNLEEMFLSGRPVYPVERTLLTSGVLEAALESRYRGHVRLETPHLEVQYASYDRVPHRPVNPRPPGVALG